jgi:hypothetical protein
MRSIRLRSGGPKTSFSIELCSFRRLLIKPLSGTLAASSSASLRDSGVSGLTPPLERFIQVHSPRFRSNLKHSAAVKTAERFTDCDRRFQRCAQPPSAIDT